MLNLFVNHIVENYPAIDYIAIKTKKGAQGVLVTSVLVVDGAPVNTSVAFVPGELAIKSKKGHGIITTPKSKKEKDTDEEVDEEETSEENED